jgi:SAM-dependent methyltransferase
LKAELKDMLNCSVCHQALQETEKELRCPKCGRVIPLQNGIPLFTPVPETIEPFDRIERGPDQGTPWRRSNWRFLDATVKQLPTDALILDIGAGHGDFADIFTRRRYLALDVVPYAEVHITCDLTQENPFAPGAFDAVVLMNVVEHVYRTRELFVAVSNLLKPGGIAVLTIPFLLKIHQPPFDFNRYTPYALQNIAEDHGLVIEKMEGFYDPIHYLNEGIGNLWMDTLPAYSSGKRFTGKMLLKGIQVLANMLSKMIGKGFTTDPLQARSHSPLGFQVIFRKPGQKR